MSIDIIERVKSIEDLYCRFKKKEIVFKITCCDYNDIEVDINNHCPVGIVQTIDNYIERRDSHEYTPLLYMCDFQTRLLYLYGCLNRSIGIPHKYKYIFWWREINTKRWHMWFIAHPYREIY